MDSWEIIQRERTSPRGPCQSIQVAPEPSAYRKILGTGLTTMLMFAAEAGSPAGAAPIHLRDATMASGVRFVHTDGSSGRRYIVETTASGLGLIDYDGDGFVDLDNDGVRELFTAAGHLQDSVELFDRNSTYKQRNLLFRWDGRRYHDITAASGDGLDPVESSRGIQSARPAFRGPPTPRLETTSAPLNPRFAASRIDNFTLRG